MILRLLDLVYFVAFLTLVNQGLPLIGRDGLTPAGLYLTRLEEHLGVAATADAPRVGPARQRPAPAAAKDPFRLGRHLGPRGEYVEIAPDPRRLTPRDRRGPTPTRGSGRLQPCSPAPLLWQFLTS